MNEIENPIGRVDGVRFSEHRVVVEEGTALRVFEWCPEIHPDADPVFFVAGWISLLRGWQPLLEVMMPKRRVVYVETREKASAAIDPSNLNVGNFSISRLAQDLLVVAERFGLADGNAVFFGSSMGSNAILETLKGDSLRARAAFLIGPNAEFFFPLWGRIAVRVIPAWVISRLKGFVIWYLRRFRVNAREDPEQIARYQRTVRAADPLRLKLSARAVLDYSVLPGLETITAPVAVAYASSDVLHGEAEVRRIVDAIPDGRAVRCPSNTYMHTAAVAEDLESFLADIAEKQERP